MQRNAEERLVLAIPPRISASFAVECLNLGCLDLDFEVIGQLRVNEKFHSARISSGGKNFMDGIHFYQFARKQETGLQILSFQIGIVSQDIGKRHARA
jgi:hypothetical protein